MKAEWTNKDSLSIETTGLNRKAILVIDMPTDCLKCPLSDGYCWNIFPIKGKADDCPLKPLPQKKEVEVNEIDDIMHTEYSIKDIYTDKYVADIRLATDKLISLGWNACLEEIEK